MRFPLPTLAPALVFMFSASLSAQDKFVDVTTGDDANNGDTAGTAYATIQKGIDNVGSGATVNVAPGVYLERLLVDPANAVGTGAHGPLSFTIDGDGAGVIVSWPAVASRPAYGGPLITGSNKNIDAILAAVGASNLVVRDIDFDGLDDMNINVGTFTSCNIAYVNSVGRVENCSLHGVQVSPTSGAQGGFGGYVQGATSDVDFVGCTAYDTQKLFFAGVGGTMDVLDTTIIGRGKTNSIAQNGVQWTGGSNGTVENCTITGIWWSGTSFTSSGILPYDAGTPLVIRNNSLIDCQAGFYWIDSVVASIDVLIEGNTFTHTSEIAQNGNDAIEFYTFNSVVGSWIVRNNVFHENYGNSVKTNISGGTITGNTFDDTGSVFSLHQARDNSAGGNNWNGNNWSDFATNSGFDAVYNVPGTAIAVDNNPSSVIPGLGSANAIPTSTAFLPLGPSCVATGDLNGDGFLDIVVGLSDQALGTDDKIEIMLSGGVLLGVAVFTPPGATYTVGDEPTDLAIGDVTGDGRLDLVVVCKGDHTVHILAGDGLGSFAPHHVLIFGGSASETQPTAVVIAELAGAGEADLAVSFQGSLLSGGTAKVMRNDGGAVAFTSLPIAGLTVGSGMGVDFGNFDGDADLELAITDSGSTITDNKVHIIDNSAGTFTQTATLTSLASPRGIDVGDVNGDGRSDLAVGCFGDGGITDDGGIVVFFGDGAGAFPTSTSSIGFGGRRGTSAVAIADLNSDSGLSGSLMDVVGLNLASANYTGLLGYTGGAFGLTRTAASGGTTPTDFAIANLDNDCAPDLIVVDFNAQSIFVHYGAGGALAQTFGTGCAGISGIPVIGTFGTPAVPTIGNATFGVSLSNARAFTPAVLIAGIGTLPGGCLTLIPEQVFFTLETATDSVGGAQLLIPVPLDPTLDCLELILQWAALDTAGGFDGIFSTSNGLRVRVGHN